MMNNEKIEEMVEDIKSKMVPGEINIDEYVQVNVDETEGAPKEQAENTSLTILSFPWDTRMEGVEFKVGNVSLRENEDESASLYFNYDVLSSPNITLEEETTEHTVLDHFVGRVIECLIYDMAKDDDFMKKMEEMETVEMPDNDSKD